jgi:two-component system nitrate/nitrite response regulator NarL
MELGVLWDQTGRHGSETSKNEVGPWSRGALSATAGVETTASHTKFPLMTPSGIRILVVDDHPVVRRGIRACLQRQPGLSVVGEAADGIEALELIRTLQPEVVLTDLDMPRMDGLALTQAVHREFPEVKILILSMHANTEYILRILQSGAAGYVSKEADPAELLQAIHAVHRGESYFSADVARQALKQMVVAEGTVATATPELTQRERQVLLGIAQGLTNKQIAERLGVGIRTVETHRQNIMEKLGIHTVAGLTRYAVAKGLLPSEARPSQNNASPSG